ncbi:MAG: radical SAM family heme chaperone HemW [Ignavibacteria bacterium]|nr:radical SAM family heme chaperone HemW [Ignavibacteria bacterium]
MLGLYIHIPFCLKKCSYCDFYSIINLAEVDDFVKALRKEIEFASERLALDKVETIFLGGGTPSILEPRYLEIIVNSIDKSFDLSYLTEFTIECNPGSDFLKNLSFYKSIGVNRISIGVQSLISEELEFLGRVHSVGEALLSIETALQHFDNVSVDILFSIPNQNASNLEKTLDLLGNYDLKHISAYSLIYEEGTRLYLDLVSKKIEPLSEKEDYALYKLIYNKLTDAGFNQYEVSNYAKNGYEAKHNLMYWRRDNYIGFGPSAHSFINNKRWWNYRGLKQYFEHINDGKLPIEGEEDLTFEQRLTETIMLGLRSEGIIFKKFDLEFNTDLKSFGYDLFELWVSLGLANFTQDGICLTNDGYFVADKLTLELLEKLEQILEDRKICI